ncbi:MAG: PPOX class F420-dependent oxidoreductase [Nitrososphaera sp.]|uniref:PPOX class F420-dependent oxidoreductase n=1 Tax=Nitrososphaera sp. TaxID=1971748 RepID=UPI0017A6E430|nr:PPOX class F420-dependent oxidoreductase [Nitrososphaera sp.]NWG37209.1 PPOX class F420-dependent oxidoreductase [Nitrososphaera sp.]
MPNSQSIPEQARSLFQGKNFAYLSTLMNDGSPQVSPVWIDIEGDEIIVNTAQGRIKQKNVSRDPRVAISVADSTNPYTMIAVQGRVVKQTTEGAEEHIDQMAKKYLGVDKYPGRAPGEKRILLRIKPEKVHYQSFRG